MPIILQLSAKPIQLLLMKLLHRTSKFWDTNFWYARTIIRRSWIFGRRLRVRNKDKWNDVGSGGMEDRDFVVYPVMHCNDYEGRMGSGNGNVWYHHGSFNGTDKCLFEFLHSCHRHVTNDFNQNDVLILYILIQGLIYPNRFLDDLIEFR